MLGQDQGSCSHSECPALPASGRSVSDGTQQSRAPSSPTYQFFNHSSRCTAHAKSSTVEDIHGNLWRNGRGLGHILLRPCWSLLPASVLPWISLLTGTHSQSWDTCPHISHHSTQHPKKNASKLGFSCHPLLFYIWNISPILYLK